MHPLALEKENETLYVHAVYINMKKDVQTYANY